MLSLNDIGKKIRKVKPVINEYGVPDNKYMDGIYILESLELGPPICNNIACNRNGVSRCARCRKAIYCGTGCQREDWNFHKVSCGTGSESEPVQLIKSATLIKEDGTKIVIEANYIYCWTVL